MVRSVRFPGYIFTASRLDDVACLMTETGLKSLEGSQSGRERSREMKPLTWRALVRFSRGVVRALCHVGRILYTPSMDGRRVFNVHNGRIINAWAREISPFFVSSWFFWRNKLLPRPLSLKIGIVQNLKNHIKYCCCSPSWSRTTTRTTPAAKEGMSTSPTLRGTATGARRPSSSSLRRRGPPSWTETSARDPHLQVENGRVGVMTRVTS